MIKLLTKADYPMLLFIFIFFILLLGNKITPFEAIAAQGVYLCGWFSGFWAHHQKTVTLKNMENMGK